MNANLKNKVLYAVVAETDCKIITDTADEDLTFRNFILYFLRHINNTKNIKIYEFCEYG
jgi:hypothetical protein